MASERIATVESPLGATVKELDQQRQLQGVEDSIAKLSVWLKATEDAIDELDAFDNNMVLVYGRARLMLLECIKDKARFVEEMGE